MSWLFGIIGANIALAVLGAYQVWRMSHQRVRLSNMLGETQRLSQQDHLTDLYNRHHLSQLVQRRLQDGQGAALLVVDLDDFKVVNDTMGHISGDGLLIEVAKRLATQLGDGDTLARLGGDEFAILTTDKATASELAERIHGTLKDAFTITDEAVSITASIGIAVSDDTVQDASELLRRGDVAMYVSKTMRHEAYQIYLPQMDEALQLRRTISAELDQALANNQLQLVYQPLVCARTGKLMSAEALMRWPSKEGMASSPGVFIPIAEETGLIAKLGEWTLDQAAQEIKRQQTIPIAVNVSPVQFRIDGFADSVEAAIKRHEIDPKLLRIEITEGVLISHTEQAQRTMKRLRAMGVQVLLDDFGTGYSSLSYLQKFEFDGLKIDRAFIQQLDDGITGRQLLKSIIALGHSLNMKVIAEGVETEDQAALLQLLRCDFLQGYACGRPDIGENLQSGKVLEALTRHRGKSARWMRAVN